jgi:hypothetical protein
MYIFIHKKLTSGLAVFFQAAWAVIGVDLEALIYEGIWKIILIRIVTHPVTAQTRGTSMPACHIWSGSFWSSSAIQRISRR